MVAMHLEQVQRFILAKKIFWGYGHFNFNFIFACSSLSCNRIYWHFCFLIKALWFFYLALNYKTINEKMFSYSFGFYFLEDKMLLPARLV